MNEDEIFYPVPEYEGFYEINRLGVIKSVDRYEPCRNGKRFRPGVILSPGKDIGGYLTVSLTARSIGLSAKTWKVHRLVAITFLSRIEGLDVVNHKNGIRTDNRVQNLEWCDQTYNNQYRFVLGYKMHNRLLSEEAVFDIWHNAKYNSYTLYRPGSITVKELMIKYGVAKSTIQGVLNGRKYSGITKNYSEIATIRKETKPMSESTIRNNQKQRKGYKNERAN